MEVRCLKFSQQGREIYVTALKGKVIATISDVDSVDRDPDGYQREREPRRCNELKEFIEKVKGLIPGAVLLNVRPEKMPEVSFNGEGTYNGMKFGTLCLPDYRFAWQMDGQHRIGAFELLQEDITVPVVLVTGLSRALEAETFFVVNSKQKNVSASLRYYDLMRYAEEETKRYLEKGEKEARELEYRLTMKLSETNLWRGRIKLPGMRGMRRAINLKGFMDSLDSLVKDRGFATFPFDMQLGFVKAFWEAVDRIWPTALAPNSVSVLNLTFGVHVAHGTAIDIYHYCSQLNDFSLDAITKLLEPIRKLVGDWDPSGALGPYIGGGRRAVALVTEMLRAEVRGKFEEIRSQSS